MDTKKKTLDFEQTMQTLESIVQQLETGNLPLEDALKAYEKGVKLATQCQQALTQAEQKVVILSHMDALVDYHIPQDDA